MRRGGWIWARRANPQHEAAPLTLGLGHTVLEGRRARADGLGPRVATDPDGHMHVQGAAALLLMAVPRAHDVAQRRLAAQEALVELLPPARVEIRSSLSVT